MLVPVKSPELASVYVEASRTLKSTFLNNTDAKNLKTIGAYTESTDMIDTGGKFAAGVVDTGGYLPVSLTPVANLPPVSTTLGKLVAKFAAGVVDTGGKP
jgi:hypothetical protein